jgi:hypothetical protein
MLSAEERRDMVAEIIRLEAFKASNPDSGLVAAINNRINWLQRKLEQSYVRDS